MRQDRDMKLRATVIALAATAALALPAINTAHAAGPKTFTVGANRPTTVFLPALKLPKAPLLIMLHSYSTSGVHQENYMRLALEASKRGIVYLHPDGTIDKKQNHFWNAAKACCDNFNAQPDDTDYITQIINEIEKKTPIDRTKIYLVGHSNGAFMSLAYACTHDTIAGVVSLAGALDQDFQCTTTKPTAYLGIHGTKDQTIKFLGRTFHDVAITSATQTAKTFATLNACQSTTTSTQKDFEPTIAGKETTTLTYQKCKAPTALWEIKGGVHSPKLPKDFAKQVIDFLTQS